MTILKRLWRQRSVVYVIIVPVFLLPIALVDPQSKWQCAYVVALMACYWLPEVLPIAVTSLLPVVLFPAFGIITAKDIAKSYIGDATLVFFGGMVVAIAIEVWDLHKRIALRTLLLAGTKPKRLMFGLMASTWLLSMWMSNTATTAMMVPIARAILAELPRHEEPTENIQNEPTTSDENLRDNKNRAFQRLSKGLTLCIAYSANIGGITTLTGTLTNIVLKGQTDVLYRTYNVQSPVTFGLWVAFSLPLSFLLLILAWAWLQIFFLPKTCRKRCCSKSDGADPDDSVKRVINEQYRSLGPTTFAQYSVLTVLFMLAILWISRDLGGTGGWGMLFSPGYVSDATPAILASVLLFILPSKAPCRTEDASVMDDGETRLLSWKQFHSKMSWSILLLLGGGFALARGCEVSGLSEWVGERFQSLSNLHPTLMLFILCYVVTVLTQVTSNIAIATLLLPILSQIAIATNVNPLYYMFPATLSASMAFLLPVATPPNAIVFASGYIKVIDMVLAGLVLNIITIPFVVMATETWGKPLFNLDIFPDYFRNVTLDNITLFTRRT